MSEEIEPCPICDSDIHLAIVGFKGRVFVECHNCDQFVVGTDEYKVIQEWNKRANNGG